MILKARFKKPEGTTEEDLAEFIYDALETWGGQRHPSDPLFYSLELEYVVVNGKKFLPPESST